MRNIVDKYVKKFTQERRKTRRAVAILLALALLVSTGVSWQLHATGIALTNETYCGLEEHTHTEECYEQVLVCGQEESEGAEGHTHTEECYETQQVLVCGQEESSEHTHTEECYEEQQVLVCGLEESEGVSGHTHTEDCYEKVLVCGLEEHTHTVECMSNESADVETAADWKDTLPDDLTGELAENVVAVAKSQLGYTESTANFTLDDDGETRKGYTRYGAWYGNEYGDWDAMFASFCLYYAGVDEDDFPEASGAYAWSVELNKQDLYADAEDYTPAPGDLVFFDTDDDGKIDCVGIVEKLDTDTDDDGTETITKLYVIQGDYAESADDTDAVCEVEYEPDDETIVGFGTVSAVADAEESDPDDTDAEPAETVTGSGDFTYEDENVTIQVHAEGTVSAPVSEDETAEAEDETVEAAAASLDEDETEEAGTDELSWDNVTMEVTVLDEASETYALLAEYADELTEENSELSILEVVSFYFYYDGEEVDASDWTLTAEVTPVVQEEAAIALIDEDGDTSEDEDDEAEAVATVTYTLLEPAGGSGNEAAVATVSSDEDEPTLTAADLTGNSPVMLLAASGTTDFTVEYYAYLDLVQYVEEEDGTLALLDTSGGVLPSNNTSNAKTYITLIETSSGYQIKTEEQLTEIYTSVDCTVEENNNVDSVNKLRNNPGYTLSQVWVSASDTDSGAVEDDDGAYWMQYDYADGMTFTNVEASADGTSIIYIPDDALVRLVYNTESTTEKVGANLYDYDITDDGTNTSESGINSSSNYSSSGAKLAFGNNNTETGLANETLYGYYINRANSNTVDYSCSFGIAAGLNSDGTIRYSDGIVAPALFNESTSVTGKTTYSGQTLTFSQVGDTYTLSSVSGPNGYSITNLEYFTKLTNYVYSDGTAGATFWNNTIIYTNNFWPMDGVTSTDGQHGHYGETGSWCPVSDDSKDHNSYFGMQYSVEFTLTEDYCGPLNYLFFGDDDMWVFLTDENGNSTLICDIGGVHSSVGEYVDLWDYISLGSSGTYTLTFFYTERGASGSTCYTQFTLPSVTSSTTVQNTGNLKVEKEVDSDEATGDETFNFTLSLKNSSGTALTNTYIYDIHNADGTKASSGTIGDGETFTLKDGQYILVEYLPVGTKCTVTETTITGYTTYYTVGSGSLTEGYAGFGSITNGGTLTMKFVNSTPDVEKEVQDSSGNWGDDNTTSIGSNVQFKTTISDVSNVTNLVLHDKLDTGLADPFEISVMVFDSSDSSDEGTEVDSAYYTVTYYTGENATGATTTDECDFEISFTDGFLATLSDDDVIVVRYYATLTEDAKIGMTDGGNENTTAISYGDNNTYSDWDTTTTYTFQIDILKHYGDEELSGAEFILYKTYTGTIGESKTVYTFIDYAMAEKTEASYFLTGWTEGSDVPGSKTYADAKSEATTFVSDENGTICIKGLAPGTYYLEETKAPDGYTLLSDPVTITVGSDGTVTYTVDGAEVNASTTDNQVQVENEPGYELPLTGGTGTYWYTMAGTLLIGGAAYLMYRNLRRRKGERQF
ncbi:MAG: SpaH/EbpB family LPXTG-anchored major pilin [Clostridiales bacterium]|nr:SpaH/EbpB family LPXTG-anchored major pilin [Clostridiales bacterium]